MSACEKGLIGFVRIVAIAVKGSNFASFASAMASEFASSSGVDHDFRGKTLLLVSQ